MSVSNRSPGRGGLQAERTALAWERTALALVANGVLLFVRDAGSLGGGASLGAVVALTASVAVAWLGVLRGRRIRRLPAVVNPARGSLWFCGVTVALLGVCVLGVVVLRWSGR